MKCYSSKELSGDVFEFTEWEEREREETITTRVLDWKQIRAGLGIEPDEPYSIMPLADANVEVAAAEFLQGKGVDVTARIKAGPYEGFVQVETAYGSNPAENAKMLGSLTGTALRAPIRRLFADGDYGVKADEARKVFEDIYQLDQEAIRR